MYGSVAIMTQLREGIALVKELERRLIEKNREIEELKKWQRMIMLKMSAEEETNEQA